MCASCRFLATGDSYTTIAQSYGLGTSTVSEIVHWLNLSHFLASSATKPDASSGRKQMEIYCAWLSVKMELSILLWGHRRKHVVLKAPPKSGSLFHNYMYKGTFSIVLSLMAVVDANYCFVVKDVGAYSRSNVGGIFANSKFGIGLKCGHIRLLDNGTLPSVGEMPHVPVGDEAFPLNTYLMRPNPGRGLTDGERIFNYRLSRARRYVENAFGILAARWRIFHRKIEQHPDTAEWYC